MGSDSIYQKNLKQLRKRSPQLGAALEAASCEDIEEVVGPRGANVLRERGVLLGSAYDPVREAQRMAETMAAEPADIMIAIGFGLGAQFAPYCEDNPGTVIVFEPSPSRLRAALSRISLVNLSATERDFYITTDLDQFSRLLDARYFPGLRIQVFTHPAVLRLDPDAVTRAVERTRRVKEASDTSTITSIDQMIPWARIVAGNGRRIASKPSFGALKDRFLGKPAVVVAAGPSLDKQLPLLREHQDRIVIIAIGQTVKALAAAGINPHFVHVLESRNVAHQLTDAGTQNELNVILAPDCHPDLFDVSVRNCFVSTTSNSPMGRWIEAARPNPCFTLGGGTVAQGAVGLAQMMGANPILLIGQDLAFTDGRAYAKDSAYGFVGIDIGDDGSCEFTNGRKKVALLGDKDLDTVRDRLPTDLIWVDGWNDGERVPTWRAYAAFIEQYRDIGGFLRAGDIRLINCTEGGARIPGIDHVPFAETLANETQELEGMRAAIDDCHEAATIFEADDFTTPIAKARKSLDRIERETQKALRFADRAESAIKAKGNQQTIDVLRRLARYEKKVRKQLVQIPWLDALVQPEIYNSMAAVRRTERLDPSVEELLEESRFLFEAARRGVGRARQWFEDFEASFRGEASAKIASQSTSIVQRSSKARLASVSP